MRADAVERTNPIAGATLPVVIVAGPRAMATAALATRYYADAGISSTVVRPRISNARDSLFAPETRFIDDEALPGVDQVRSFLEAQRPALARFNRTPGWFLQQFIKLAVVAQSDTEYLFLADGDTIFSHALLRSILHQPTILTTGEAYGNYDRLLLAIDLVPPRSSCVANGNIFSRSSFICKLADPAAFEALLRDHVIASCGALDFSEYQITGALLEPALSSRRIRMFRRFDLLVGNVDAPSPRAVTRALRRYDAVAVEANHHRSVSRRVAARLLYGLGRSW